MRLARKMIRCCRQTPIRTLSQWILRGMKLDFPVRDVVGRFNSRSTGIVIVKFPRSQSAVVRYAAANFDQACGTEVRPSELFLARPNQFHRLVHKLCEARRLNGYFAGVLSAVTRARIGHDDA